MGSSHVSKSATSAHHGPLGPAYQPYYDGLYAIQMQFFNLPHLSVFSLLALIYAHWNGHITVTPAMPLVALFGMARIPFVGCCMSISLHRYFAHGAFKTSRPFQFVLGVLSTMALQGGPLWWASKHRRHHKHCDTPLDPHSPIHQGELHAWLGWMYSEAHHDWIYVPKRLLTPEMLFINICFPFPNLMVTYGLTRLISIEWALFLCWVPALVGALATTQFNVEYHPVPEKAREGVCYAVDKLQEEMMMGPLKSTWVQHYFPWVFDPLVGESFHADHHVWPSRAHRPGVDGPYALILKYWYKWGLIWDLQQPMPCNDPSGLAKYPILRE